MQVHDGAQFVDQFRVATQYCAEPRTSPSGFALVTGNVCTIPVSNLEGAEFDLKDGDGVYARIVAFNCIGASSPSDVVNGAIIPSVPSAPIGGTCGSRTFNSVTFSWNNGALDGGAPITGY
jgi:hypothetical protein